MTTKYHESVMVKEVLENLHINTGSKIIDCTLGTGGHAEALVNKGVEVLGIEVDPRMLRVAKERLGDNAKLVLGNFSNIDRIAIENGFEKVDGILFDLGVSNLHLKADKRGFSFTEKDQLLDMRLNPDIQGVAAYDLLNALDKTQLTNLFAKVLKMHEAVELAKRVFENRPIKTVGDLKRLAFGVNKKRGLDSATLPMLALRIAVNSELENLEEVLPKAYELLRVGGKLVVITFHSGEEEIVKKFTNGQEKVIFPNPEEVRNNLSARSAKLYVLEKYEN